MDKHISPNFVDFSAILGKKQAKNGQKEKFILNTNILNLVNKSENKTN